MSDGLGLMRTSHTTWTRPRAANTSFPNEGSSCSSPGQSQPYGVWSPYGTGLAQFWGS